MSNESPEKTIEKEEIFTYNEHNQKIAYSNSNGYKMEQKYNDEGDIIFFKDSKGREEARSYEYY